MTDKNLKQEDVTLSVKGTRVHSSASLHQLPQANATVLAPAAHPGYNVPPEVIHPSHLSYTRMLQPSFQHYPIPLPASLPGPKASHDLGPPIFMPPLNLGVPKSSVSSLKQQQPLPVVSSISSSVATPTSLHSTHIDGGGSSPTVMSYPIHGPSAMLHPSQQTFQSLNTATKTQQKNISAAGSGTNTTRDSDQLKKSFSNQNSVLKNNIAPSSVTYAQNSVLPPNRSTVQANILKQPGVTKATAAMPGMVELATSGYSSSSGSQFQHQPHPPNNNKSSTKLSKEDSSNNGKNKTDTNIDGQLAVSSGGSGLGPGGSGLLCLEGLPPPVPRNITSSGSSDMKSDRSSNPSHPNHILDSHHSIGSNIQGSTDNQIPWPEAVSKNIIIPAPNLTGKDIANLTSASSSPIATNDRTGNDITWLPLNEHHQQSSSTHHNHHNHHHHHHHHTSSSSMDSMATSTSNSSSSLSSYINVADSSHPHSGSNTSTSSMGMGLMSQNPMSSPRPSILRKRGFDGRQTTTISGGGNESLNSPSSPVMHKILRQRSRGSPCEQSDNHFLKEDVSSPRKRPRKQHLHIDSTNDHHFPSHSLPDGESCSTMAANSSHDPINSMMANERLLGPLPLKEKANCEEDDPITSRLDKESSSGLHVLYISQLRRPQYPIVQLCRRPHRTARNHFRRQADIKQKEEGAVSPHDMCSQGSTWLSSSGWKLQHFSSQLDKMDKCDSDVIDVLEQLKEKTESVLKSMNSEELEEKHRTFLRETLMGNIERVKRSRLHTQETKESMMKVLNMNGKVVELMKKFAVSLPTKHLVATTSIIDELESNPS